MQGITNDILHLPVYLLEVREAYHSQGGGFWMASTGHHLFPPYFSKMLSLPPSCWSTSGLGKIPWMPC
jgi:hypothetical protein